MMTHFVDLAAIFEAFKQEHIPPTAPATIN